MIFVNEHDYLPVTLRVLINKRVIVWQTKFPDLLKFRNKDYLHGFCYF